MNFILRIVANHNFPGKEVKKPNPTPIVNRILGEEYQTVLKNVHTKEFEELSKGFYTPENMELFGVVVQADGRKHGLWSDATHYIMIENGATFEKIHNPHSVKEE